MPTAGEQVALSGYTTLGLGGPARRLVEAASEAEIVAEVAAADRRQEPVLVLGGGSNLVIPDEGFPGTVVRIASRGLRREHAADGRAAEGRAILQDASLPGVEQVDTMDGAARRAAELAAAASVKGA